jgi:poly-gamma-glutamate synthesis protein (capsule biosynthesis protein)
MEEKLTMAAVGDVFVGRGVQATISEKGPGHIFGLVKPCLAGHDVVFGNLESPISRMQVPEGNRGLIARPAALDELQEAGFNVVSIANNHTMDFGLPGLRDTIAELEKRGIGYAGAGLSEADARKPLRKVGGRNVTLLAYYGLGRGKAGKHGGPNGGARTRVLQDIRNARDETDIVLVYLHWGRGASLPMKHQVEFAHEMIDCGAKVILASGPHFLQPVEQYNGGVIAYSLGNFVFDSNAQAKRRSMILHISFVGGSVESVAVTPVRIGDGYRPELIDPSSDPDTYEAIRSLLVERLARFESDAGLVPQLGGRVPNLMTVLKKIVLPGHRAYPLSFYLGGLRELIKERWISRS